MRQVDDIMALLYRFLHEFNSCFLSFKWKMSEFFTGYVVLHGLKFARFARSVVKNIELNTMCAKTPFHLSCPFMDMHKWLTSLETTKTQEKLNPILINLFSSRKSTNFVNKSQIQFTSVPHRKNWKTHVLNLNGN